MSTRLLNFIGFIFDHLVIGTIILGFFALLVAAVHKYWTGKKPEWLEYLYGHTAKLMEIPRWIILVFIIYPAQFVEALWGTVVETTKKLRSRPYQVFFVVFFLVYKIIEFAFTVERDPQTLFGIAAVLTAAAALMMYASKKLIESRDLDHKQAHEQKLSNGDHDDVPPGPEEEVVVSSKGCKKK